MEHETRFHLFVLALVILFILAIIYIIRSVNKEKRIIAQVKHEYDQAILEGNKPKALQLGRKYYALLRGGRLSIYDEQAITNDLSTINTITENTRK